MESMTMTDQALPVAAKVAARLAESIAHETDTPVEVVQVIYDKEFSAVDASATIKQYVGVVASRRVRLRLQKH